MLSKTPTDSSMQQTTRLDLPLVLPDVPDGRDACIARLTSMLEAQPGVVRVHVLDVTQRRVRRDPSRAQCCVCTMTLNV